MKQALILGCSHAAGSEMHKGLDNSLDFDYGRDNSYPVIIARSMGYTPNNQSITGGSNDAIFRIYEEQQSTLDHTDIVIACWSGYNRTEIWNEQNKNWQPMAPGKEDNISKEYLNYQQQWIMYHTNDRVGRLNKIKNILALNCLAAEKNIRVINIDSFWSVSDMIWPKLVNWPVDDNLWNWCIKHGYPRTDWGHFFKPAHQAFAEFVIRKGGYDA